MESVTFHSHVFKETMKAGPNLHLSGEIDVAKGDFLIARVGISRRI